MGVGNCDVERIGGYASLFIIILVMRSSLFKDAYDSTGVTSSLTSLRLVLIFKSTIAWG